ncbi:MAG TPA: Rid family detoxifying hydrolase [Bryobacteraceae bacterium]|nr:Rid family detoxifying hydrolase [Bryobacteraceae bacterium]
MIERISPPGAPAPRGPYSPAVRAGDYIYVAGQIPIDPISGQVVSGDIQAETRQVLTNIKNILEGCGSSMSAVVRCGVYLIDANDFKSMNEVYAEFFGEAKPARTTIIVAALPLKDARVEIDAIAYTAPMERP